jgi:hypothetical protein
MFNYNSNILKTITGETVVLDAEFSDSIKNINAKIQEKVFPKINRDLSSQKIN